MFLFAHAGITLGAATLIAGAAERKAAAEPGTDWGRRPLPFADWFEALARFLDIRVLLVGALLPDIIDKPLGLLLIGDGRGYAHTLAFSLVLIIAAIILFWRRRHTWLLALAFGSVCHLLLDSMWQNPRTLFWPFYVWTLPSGPRTNWLSLWGAQFVENPGVDISEAIGLGILLWFCWTLAHRQKLGAFLKRGRF